MAEVSALTLAEMYSQGGRTLYEQQHEVHPMVAILNEEGDGVAMVPAGDGHPTDMLALLVGLAVPIVQTRYIVTVVEGWSKEYKEEPQNFQRGYLEQLHEGGDDSVKTVILTMVIDIEASFEHQEPWGTTISLKDQGRADGGPKVVWDEPMIHEGQHEGMMPDLLLRSYLSAWDTLNELPEEAQAVLRSDPTQWMVKLLELGLVSEALLSSHHTAPQWGTESMN